MTNSLDTIGWQLNRRRVVVRMLGSDFRFNLKSPANIEYLGFRSVRETVKILSRSDINYLPYPFEPALSHLTRSAFPTKLSSYAAAGRPVFMHAPARSSLARFFEDHPIGVFCESLEPADVLRDLNRFIEDSEAYSAAARRISQVAQVEFSQETYTDRFLEFVGGVEKSFSPTTTETPECRPRFSFAARPAPPLAE